MFVVGIKEVKLSYSDFNFGNDGKSDHHKQVGDGLKENCIVVREKQGSKVEVQLGFLQVALKLNIAFKLKNKLKFNYSIPGTGAPCLRSRPSSWER